MPQGYKTGGRQQGTPNRITTAFKQAVQIVYDEIGGHQAFAAWARENQTDFYRIASRLIPTEITSPDNSVTIIVERGSTIEQSEKPRLSDLTEH
jgi:hypothetical protein